MVNGNMRNQLTARQICEQKYKTSRTNLLLVVVFTAINILLLVTNANSYFLFSAWIPYLIVDLGMLECGRYPAEYYTGDLANMEFLDNSFFVVTLVVAAVLTLLYLLAWLCSKKQRVGWLIFALVFFVLDTVGMLLSIVIATDTIIDILFHAWVIYYLILGISAHFKLKKLPPDEEPAFFNGTVSQQMEGSTQTVAPVISEEYNS